MSCLMAHNQALNTFLIYKDFGGIRSDVNFPVLFGSHDSSMPNLKLKMLSHVPFPSTSVSLCEQTLNVDSTGGQNR